MVHQTYLKSLGGRFKIVKLVPTSEKYGGTPTQYFKTFFFAFFETHVCN